MTQLESHNVTISASCPAPAVSTTKFDAAVNIHENTVSTDLSEYMTTQQNIDMQTSIGTSLPSVVATTSSKLSESNHSIEEITICSSSPFLSCADSLGGLDVHSSGDFSDESVKNDPASLNFLIADTEIVPTSESLSVISANYIREILEHENSEKMQSTIIEGNLLCEYTEGSKDMDLTTLKHFEDFGTQSEKNINISTMSQPVEVEGVLCPLKITEEDNKGSELENPMFKNLKRRYDSFVNDTHGSVINSSTVSKRSKYNFENLNTIAHSSQNRKLASPFRSPLRTKPYKNANASEKDQGVHNVTKQDRQQNTPPSLMKTFSSSNMLKFTPLKSTNSSRSILLSSSKAASPFKSPFSGNSVSCEKAPSRSQPSPNIQILERKVSSLKRALQIKKDDKEEKLRFLIQKWRNVGREVAWELWQLFRESGQGNQNPLYRNEVSQSRSFYESNDWKIRSPQSSSADRLQRNWGWNTDVINETDESEGELASRRLSSELQDEIPRVDIYALDLNEGDVESKLTEKVGNSEYESLGGMLTSLGIPHKTLGWTEEEGDFLDVNDD